MIGIYLKSYIFIAKYSNRFLKVAISVGAIKPNGQRQKAFLRLYNNLNQPKGYIVVRPPATRSPDHSLFTIFCWPS